MTELFYKPPGWLKPYSWLMLLWNIFGLMAFIMHIMITPEQIAELPAAEQSLYQDFPLWATIAFAVAVLGGTLGSLMLLLRKRVAFPLLILSLAGALVQGFYSFIIVDVVAVMGVSALILPLLVIVLGISLIGVANKGIRENWLR